MSETQPEPNAPDHGGQAKIMDTTAMVIIGGFALVAMVVIGVMFSGYRHGHESTLAVKFYDARDYNRAIPYLEKVVNRYPDAWVRIKMLGDCYLFRSDDPKDAATAQKYYEQVLASSGYQQMMSSSATAADIKADNDLTEEFGICASKMRDEKKAQEYFNKVLSRDPDSPAANFYLGVSEFKAGNYRQAARRFQNAATGDQPVGKVQLTSDGTNEGPRPSKWGNRWDKLAIPYRQEIARRVLGAAPAPTPAPAAPQGANKG